MSLPSSLQSYPDCYDFLEKCIDDAVGARKPFKTYGDAVLFRNRSYRFRALTQKENQRIYPPEDKRYGTSDYDELVLQVIAGPDGWWWVYGRKLTIGLDDVEPLSALEASNDDQTPA